MSGPEEEDGDYAREFFGAYEREADRIADVSHAGGCGTWVGFSCDCHGLWWR